MQAGPLFLALSVYALGMAQTSAGPEFSMYTVNGSRIHVGQYSGKVVVLEFLLTTCPHCQGVAAVLKKIQAEYGQERLQVLGCSVDEMAPAKVGAFVAQFAPGFPVGFAAADAVNAYLEHDPKTLLKLPQLVFIDQTGNKRSKYIGDQPFFGRDEETNIRREIDALLGKPRVGERRH